MRITLDVLKFEARLREYIDGQFAKWEAEDIKKGRPPSERELEDRWYWESMFEETEWERFFGA